MDWIDRFQFFLFDFDGLLVNTEHLHFQAYANLLEGRGHRLDWSFAQFCALAHLNASALKEALYSQFPDLDPNWEALYEEKKRLYQELLGAGSVEMMPGAESLLRELEKRGVSRCVVTHSPRQQIEAIRAQHRVLQSIPHWLTRENYTEPKPSPEGYLRAIQLWSQLGDKMIGFEDSLRGLQALQKTPALPVLICAIDHPLFEGKGAAAHFTSLKAIPKNWLL